MPISTDSEIIGANQFSAFSKRCRGIVLVAYRRVAISVWSSPEVRRVVS